MTTEAPNADAAPVATAADTGQPVPVTHSHSYPPPLLTFAMLVVLIAVFAAELMFGVEPARGFLEPSVRTLSALGGLYAAAVFKSGEWYRVLSAALLHAGPLHLGMNCIALLIAGNVLERLVGHAWLGALFVTSALAGSFMSMALNPPGIVSVGASGAIMGLFAAMLVISFRFAEEGIRSQLRASALQTLIPSLIPLANSVTGGRVDFGAHLGGALAGAAFGLVLLAIWPRSEARPKLGKAAAVFATLGAIAFAATAIPIARGYRPYVLAGLLIPANQSPQTEAARKSQSESLLARYPHDPRAHLYRALALLDAKDLAGAEHELRAGLAEDEIMQAMFPSPALEGRMRSLLAAVLLDRKQPAEAKAIAQPICSKAISQQSRDFLNKHSLCN